MSGTPPRIPIGLYLLVLLFLLPSPALAAGDDPGEADDPAEMDDAPPAGPVYVTTVHGVINPVAAHAPVPGS